MTELPLQPPVAKKVPKVDIVHGDTRVDDYFWMRKKEDPEVRAYLEAENAYADALTAGTKDFQEALYKEMLARIKETDLSVPYREGDHFYYTRTEQGKQYAIHCRKRTLEAEEQVVLELNKMAEGHPFLGIGAFQVSEDGNLLAYSTDFTGFRQYTLRVRDLRSGEDLPFEAEKTGTVAWSADNRTLFFTTEDAAKRHHRVWRRRIDETEATLVLEEPDERFNLYVARTRSRAFLLLVAESHTTTECRFLPADRPEGEWRVIAPRVQDQEYYPDHGGDLLYLRVNDTGRNFRLVTAPVADPGRENWRELVPHRDHVMLEDVEVFANHLVLFEREDGLQQLTVRDLRTGESHRVRFPEPAYTVMPERNRVFDTTAFRYAYQSLITPPSVYDYDMVQRTQTLLKRTEVLGGYDPERYECERLHAVTVDGTRVPISLVHRKDFVRDGSQPLYLVGYGAYGHPLPVTFNSNRFSLIGRGFAFAIAHIRGGGEMGKRWHDEGRMMKKRNTFTDFIACAEHVLREGYTSRDRLCIEGGSAGGLLVGAVTNLRPDLFRVVVTKVPFVDVVNTMLDASLPLTVPEYEEWGNPQKKEEYDYLKTYCPYTNLAAKPSPAMLVRTSFNDSQVMYWEPAKYVAKLRTLKTDGNALLFRTDLGAGHGGKSGRYDFLREVAFDYAFVLGQLGISS